MKRVLYVIALVVVGIWTASSNKCGSAEEREGKAVASGAATDNSAVTTANGSANAVAVNSESETNGSVNASTTTNGSTTTQTQTQTSTSAPSTSTASSLVGDDWVVSPCGLAEQVLRRYAYTVSYNSERRNPNWVAWHLTAAHTQGDNKREGNKFRDDSDVPLPRATNADYKKSGYERGHMCPAGDNKWSARAQSESFLLSNMCPQTHACNAGDWEEIEAACRRWAKTYGEVWIACGPIYEGGCGQRTIGANCVAVPEKFFKVVLANTPQGWAAVGFVVPNLKKMNSAIRSYALSVDEVERLTGYDFFASLPDDIEQAAEATVRESLWF